MKKKAVIIGILYVDNPYPEQRLPSSAIDVQLMRKFLSDRGYKQQRVLTDGPDDPHNPIPNKRYPGSKEILESLKWLVEDASPESQLFLHYSGHGDQSPTDSNTETDGMDEVMRPARGQPIRDNELRAILVDKLPPGCQLVVTLDCCHSGTLLDLQFRAKAEKCPVSQERTVNRDSERALVRGWRWLGHPAIYSVRLNSPNSTPLLGKRRSTHPTPPGAQILIRDPSLLRWSTADMQKEGVKPNNQPKDGYFPAVIADKPITEPPSPNSEPSSPSVALIRKPSATKWILKRIPKIKSSKGKQKASKVGSSPPIPQGALVQSPASYARPANIQNQSQPPPQTLHQHQYHSQPLPSISPLLTPEAINRTTTSGPVAQAGPVRIFDALSEDAGYDVNRRGTFSAFHTPSGDLRRVIAYSACTDDQRLFDIHGEGGLLTTRFVQFMDEEEHTLASMLIKLTEEFAYVNDRHEHGTPGKPPLTLLCTADHMNLHQPLII